MIRFAKICTNLLRSYEKLDFMRSYSSSNTDNGF